MSDFQKRNLKAILPTVLQQFDRWNVVLPTYKHVNLRLRFCDHCALQHPKLIFPPPPHPALVYQVESVAARSDSCQPATARARPPHAHPLHQADARATADVWAVLLHHARQYA